MMPDSFVVIGLSYGGNEADSIRFWSRRAAEAATAFIDRNATIEATSVDDPTPVRIPPPTNTVPPVIQTLGNLVVGQTVVLANHGTWTGSPTYTRQWLNGGVVIPGAVATSYVLRESDVGQWMTCLVTGTNAGGSAIATSNALGPIEPAP